MLLVPARFQAVRGILLILIVLFSFNNIEIKRINKSVSVLWYLTFIVSFLSIVYGAFVGNPGALPYFSVFVAWPILYLYFMYRSNSLSVIIDLLKTLNIGMLFVASFNLIMIINEAYLHFNFLITMGEVLGCQYNIDLDNGVVRYFTPSQSLLPYIIYYSLTYILLGSDSKLFSRKISIASFVIALLAIFLSARRAMWTTIALLPFVLIVVFKLLNLSSKIVKYVVLISLFISGILLLLVNYYLDIDNIVNMMQSISNFTDNESNYERSLQYKSMLNDFFSSPIFGKGIGYVSSYVRTPEHPWEYELVYNYLLSSVGIVGFVIYSYGICWLYVKSFKLSRINLVYCEILIPQLMGLFAFLIINATNPYLLKFDFLWILFLPIVSINSVLNNASKNEKKSIYLRER